MDSLRISQLAERAQVPVSTVRYYERIGLLAPPERLSNGYRVYDEVAAEHLAFIGRAKRMGVPLEEVAELIELWSTGGCRPLQDRIRAFLAGRIAEIQAQRRELGAFERQLQGLSDRIDGRDGSPGLCELDCECVHLDEADPLNAPCARFPAASREPVSGCTLRVDDQADRIAEWAEMLDAAQRVERTGHHVRAVYQPSPALAGRLALLCAAEIGCCSSLRFALEIQTDAIVLVVGGSDAPAVLHQVFGPWPR